MSENPKHKSPKSIIFGGYKQPIYSDDPAVELEPIPDGELHKDGRDRSNLTSTPLTGSDPLFGGSVTWPYRGYIVRRLSAGATAAPLAQRGGIPRAPGPHNIPQNPPLGVTPSQPVFQAAAQSYGGLEHAEDPYICLFNVIVALEWNPDRDYLVQLEWAFRRASDFLYDITDGRMAFGQVVFGGAEWMDRADILILASTQLHPRSWVDGLHDKEKYTPIRLGRGSWPSRNRVTIPWDEPEAYRTLVHEWGHYALGLRDEYLEMRPLTSVRNVKDNAGQPDARLKHVHSQLLLRREGTEAEDYTVVIPRPTTSSASIMANLEGTSELVPHASGQRRHHKEREWEEIVKRYPWLRQPDRTLEGPGRLPLPLPLFRCTKGLADALPKKILMSVQRHKRPEGETPADGEPMLYRIYVLRGPKLAPEHIIAQGMPDARFQDEGLQLYGAQEDDTVVLVGTDQASQPAVYCQTIGHGEELEVKIGSWEPATPDPFPRIDVVPSAILPDLENDAGIMARISVHVSVNETTQGAKAQLPAEVEVRVFPLGQPEGKMVTCEMAHRDAHSWVSQECDIKTLDGNVFVRCGENLMITTFSHGGNPPSSTPAYSPAPPITAGSLDGDVMLFFSDQNAESGTLYPKEMGQQYSKIKVVTTVDNGAQGEPPAAARACSRPFSLASNKRLPEECLPTLVVHYQRPDERELLTGDLLICRLKGGRWIEQPTYLPAGASLAATPLNRNTVPGLFEGDGPHVEYYQLFWIPRAQGDGKAA